MAEQCLLIAIIYNYIFQSTADTDAASVGNITFDIMFVCTMSKLSVGHVAQRSEPFYVYVALLNSFLDL